MGMSDTTDARNFASGGIGKLSIKQTYFIGSEVRLWLSQYCGFSFLHYYLGSSVS